MIKIAIDISPLHNQNALRGIGKYTRLLIEFLQREKEITVVQKKSDADLIHYPFFDFYFPTLPLRKGAKTVVTVHDCIPLVFPQKYPPGIKGRINFARQKLSLKGACAVITDSESSRNDIHRYLGISKEKIFVVYLAADPIFRTLPVNKVEEKKIREKYGLGQKFILYVGDVNYNKNLIRLIRSFNSLLSAGRKSLNLVFIGKTFKNTLIFETKQLVDLIGQLNLKDKVKFLGFVPDQDLVKIYNIASVYCQPSLYEGFGLQLLEAMVCSCPVITANISSMPEVAGEAALLVDPNSDSEITAALEKVLSDRETRERLISLGRYQTIKFSWEKTARKTIDVYKKCL